MPISANYSNVRACLNAYLGQKNAENRTYRRTSGLEFNHANFRSDRGRELVRQELVEKERRKDLAVH